MEDENPSLYKTYKCSNDIFKIDTSKITDHYDKINTVSKTKYTYIL